MIDGLKPTTNPQAARLVHRLPLAKQNWATPQSLAERCVSSIINLWAVAGAICFPRASDKAPTAGRLPSQHLPDGFTYPLTHQASYLTLYLHSGAPWERGLWPSLTLSHKGGGGAKCLHQPLMVFVWHMCHVWIWDKDCLMVVAFRFHPHSSFHNHQI